jgi:ankyrin repeat protein
VAAPKDILGAIYRGEIGVLAAATNAEVNAQDEDGRTPLMHAVLAENADASIVKTLIDRGADVHVADTNQRWTALHFAARDQKEPIVAVLLDAGAEVEAVDVFGNTPLMRSVGKIATISIVRRLTERGADPKRKNKYGVSPMELARDIGRDDIVAVFDHTAP